MGLALPRESVGEVKERRKPDRRWQNRETGGGFPQTSRIAQATRFGNICRGKALRIGKVVLFDEGAAEAVLAPRKCPGSTLREATGRDRERQRSDVSLAHGRKRQAEVVPPGGGARICTSPKGEQRRVRIGQSWRRAVKRAPSRGRIVARRSGVARKNPTLGKGKHPAVQRSASYAPGNRAVHGCSCRQSVAEVGERHLLRAIEGSREANRGCTE
jgi:hypothetical protein